MHLNTAQIGFHLWQELAHYCIYPVMMQLFVCVQLKAHAVAEGSGNAEEPMDIIVNVLDQNDNKPVFSQETYLGQVPEASPIGIQRILFKTENNVCFTLQEKSTELLTS